MRNGIAVTPAIIALAGALIWICALPVSAQPESGASPMMSPLSPRPLLGGLIEAALSSNPGIMAATSRAESEEHTAAAADGLPDPRVGVGFSPRPIETRQGPQRLRASVEQMFPFPGKRALRGEVSKTDARRRRALTESAAAGVVRQVKELFWETYRHDRAIAIARREQELLSDIARAVHARYQTGAGNQANLFQVELMRTRLENKLLLLGGMREAAVEKLAGVIGRPTDVPPTARLNEPLVSLDESSVRERVLEANPELLAAEEAVRAEELSLRLAGKGFYPDLALRAGWWGIEDEGQGGRDAWSLDAMIKVPLYRGDVRDRVRAREAALRAARQERDDLRNHLLAGAEGLTERLRSLAGSIRLHRTGLIPQAESTYESALAGYTTGELEFADLILAEQTLLEVELGLDETAALYQQTVARLEALLGAASPEPIFPASPERG